MPPNLPALKQIFQQRTYLLTLHASTRIAERGIVSKDIEEAISSGEVIEDYPEDKYGPSCLILGVTSAGRVLHVQVSYPPTVKVITLYEPSPDDWEADWKTRKNHE